MAAYLQRNGGAVSESFTVNRFVLYSSRDSVGGGPYVVEAAYDLEDARTDEDDLGEDLELAAAFGVED